MKQHYLPECFLREFCNTAGKLHTLDMNLRKHGKAVFDEPRHPASVCRSKHLYTIRPEMIKADPTLQKLDSLVLERKFGEYESRYPALIAKLKRGQTYLKKDDVDLLLYFILSLKLRNPKYREFFSSNKEGMIGEMIGKAKHIVENWPEEHFKVFGQSREEFFEEIDTQESRMQQDEQFAKRAHLKSLLAKSSPEDDMHDTFKRHLTQFEWLLFSSDAQFIISDNPGFAKDEQNRVLNTKFSDRFFYFMPLTPSLCFGVSHAAGDHRSATGDGKNHFTKMRADLEMIRTINLHQIEHLNQYVFASSGKVIKEVAEFINGIPIG